MGDHDPTTVILVLLALLAAGLWATGRREE